MPHLELSRPRPDVAVITGAAREFCLGLDLDEALTIAETLCNYGKFGLESTKQVLWANLEAPGRQAAFHLENRSQVLSTTTGEMTAATSDFTNRKNS